MKTFTVLVVVLVVLSLASNASTQTAPPPPGPGNCVKGSGYWGANCTLCNCDNGANCSDGVNGTGCLCKAVHASGVHCQTCWYNWDPQVNCQTEINPCQSCLTSDYNNCTDLTSKLCPKYADCDHVGASGTYRCRCGGGYYATPENNECIDVNECEVGVRGGKFNACPSYSTCKNYRGGYNCTCKPPRVAIRNSKGIPRYCVLPKN